MATNVPPWPGDFESVAKQYWSLWGDALRQASGPMPAMHGMPGMLGMPGMPSGWQQTVDWWSQLMPGGTGQVHDVLGRFQRQASDWFGQMQQIAGRFAGRDPAASEVGKAWREALGMTGAQPAGNPFGELFRAMQGGGHGLDGWMEQARPFLEGLQRDGNRWLHLPTFGLAREHQERWQHLVQAQQDYQQQRAEYDRLMLKVAQEAFACFERKLEERAAPGRQLENARALFDLWIDAAEEAYAQVAMSDEFRHVYGALANAQSRLRLAVIREVEQACALFGMPTRTEVDSAHRKIVELERTVRRMARAATAAPRRAPVRETAPAPAPTPETPPARPAARTAAGKPARKPARHAPAKKPPVRPRTATAAKKPAKKPAPRARAVAAAAPAPAKRAPAAKATTKPKPARKALARPAAAPARPPAKAAAKAPARSATKVPAKAPAKPAAARAKPVRKPAAANAAPSPSAISVVSMKDWVARNAARAVPAESQGGAKKTARRGSRA